MCPLCAGSLCVSPGELRPATPRHRSGMSLTAASDAATTVGLAPPPRGLCQRTDHLSSVGVRHAAPGPHPALTSLLGSPLP